MTKRKHTAPLILRHTTNYVTVYRQCHHSVQNALWSGLQPLMFHLLERTLRNKIGAE